MRIFTTVYLILLAYIIIALVFWEVRLQQQSSQIYEQELITLRNTADSLASPSGFNNQKRVFQHNLESRTAQFNGEGITFLIVILVGAFVVYRSVLYRIRLSRQQNNFMMSVTHELKSPIAAIKLNLQTIEKHRLDEDKRLLLARRSIKEADRLNDLCNNMLFASQLEGRQYKHARERFDLGEVVEQAAHDYESRYPGRFEAELGEDCQISGDRVMLMMALTNLLENAVKYAPSEKPVIIKLFRHRSQVIIQVADQGPGITDQEKKNIFNKFYRIGNEESRKAKGTGLGLYLTNKIVLQHKGIIHVKDNVPHGCIFEIVLPG